MIQFERKRGISGDFDDLHVVDKIPISSLSSEADKHFKDGDIKMYLNSLLAHLNGKKLH